MFARFSIGQEINYVNGSTIYPGKIVGAGEVVGQEMVEDSFYVSIHWEHSDKTITYLSKLPIDRSLIRELVILESPSKTFTKSNPNRTFVERRDHEKKSHNHCAISAIDHSSLRPQNNNNA